MSGREKRILAETRREQARAADPAVSAWVSANAGSGKTHVLANRVIRLLLSGAEPSRILCLTYTRAAAGEMKSRIFRTLGRWATSDDAALADEIVELEGRPPDAARLADARRLFARALETPGGLKIQTIHAFCEAILRRFPLEANIAGHFDLLDAPAEQALLAEARRSLLSGLDDPARPALSAAFARIVDAAGESGLDALLSAIVAERDGLADFIRAAGEEGWPALYRRFGLEPGASEAGLVRGLWPDPTLGPRFAAELLQAATAHGLKTAAGLAARLVEADREADDLRRFAILAEVFLKKDGDPRKPADFLPKAVKDRFGWAEEALAARAAAVFETADRLATLAMVEDTIAALTLADALLERYGRLKSGRGLLDFNDLIHRTLTLLAREDAAQWVQYKLDQGIDHLLVDEAQDTSPAQWRVVAGIVAEFFAGEGARRDAVRTLFAVGDEKQSIYSFQGADPEAFSLQRETYRRAADDAGRRFEPAVKLRQSFRSTEDVLAFVDAAFAEASARRGLTRDPEPIEHKSVRVGAPGSVELWPSLGAAETGDPADWRQAIDHARAPEVKLAQAIAAVIGRWIAVGERVEGKAGTERPMRPGDIIVLVRKRDRFMHALARALKELRPEPVAAAGADRLRLTGHIAVKDLIALARVCLQPQDDLSLAALLKSPVFGFDDDLLFDLAADRGVEPLLARLQRRSGERPPFAEAAAALARWRGEVDLKPPFEFFAGVLGRDRVRARMIARLGVGAGEILDEFLSHVLAAERVGVAGLDGLLATLEQSPPEIRRDAAEGRDEVRIMTAHAAKGLEAPVVFLVDSGGAPSHSGHLPVLMKLPFDVEGREMDGFVWRSGKASQNRRRRAREAELAAAAEDEYRRLLYVGLTRAEDRLVVCGYHGRRQAEGRWHAIAERAFDLLAAKDARRVETRRLAELDADIRRYASAAAPPPLPPGRGEGAQASSSPPPVWLLAPAVDDPPPPRPLSPSGAALMAEAEPSPMRLSPVFSPAIGASFAIRRGEAIHRLLQVLPGVPEEARLAAAEAYLARAAADWPEGEADSARDAVLAILATPDFAAVFAPGSRAEVAVQGVVTLGGRERTIAGKIDRLAIGEAILVVDYKTGRPPASPQSAAPAHVAQLALYRAILAGVDPGRPVRAALLHVDGPRLDEIEAAALDAALAGLDAALRTP